MNVKRYQSMINSRLVSFNSKDTDVPITLDDLMLLDLPIYAIGETVREGIDNIQSNISTIPNRSRFLLPTLENLEMGESRIIDKIRDTGFKEFISGGYIEVINSKLQFRVYSDITVIPESGTLNPYIGSQYINNDIIYTSDPAKSKTIGWVRSDNNWIELVSVSNSRYVERVPSLSNQHLPADHQLGKIYYSEQGLFDDEVKVAESALYLAYEDSNSDERKWLKLSITSGDIERYEVAVRDLFDDKLEEAQLLVEDGLRTLNTSQTKFQSDQEARQETYESETSESLETFKSDLTTQQSDYEQSTTEDIETHKTDALTKIDTRTSEKFTELDRKVDSSIATMANTISEEVERFNETISDNYNRLVELETSRAESMAIIEEWIANREQFKGDQGYSAFEVWKSIKNRPDATEADYFRDIKGEKGDVGAGLQIKSSLSSTSDLPKSGMSIGDAYLIGESIHVWNGSEWKVSDVVGPPGPKGDPGRDGAVGKSADPFRIVSVLSSESNLPSISSSKVNESYIIDGHLYVFNGSTWAKLFRIRGEKGDRGEVGPRGTQGIKGADGDSAFEVWRSIKSRPDATESDYFRDIKGEKGVKGDTGVSAFEDWKRINSKPSATFDDFLEDIKGIGVDIKGVVSSKGNLPTSADLGDIYLANHQLYVKSNEDWIPFNIAEVDWITKNNNNLDTSNPGLLVVDSKYQQPSKSSQGGILSLIQSYIQSADNAVSSVRDLSTKVANNKSDIGNMIDMARNIGKEVPSNTSTDSLVESGTYFRSDPNNPEVVFTFNDKSSEYNPTGSHCYQLVVSKDSLYIRKNSNRSWSKVLDVDLGAEVSDSLTSTSTTMALSANQGRRLKDMIDKEALTQRDYYESYAARGSEVIWGTSDGLYLKLNRIFNVALPSTVKDMESLSGNKTALDIISNNKSLSKSIVKTDNLIDILSPNNYESLQILLVGSEFIDALCNSSENLYRVLTSATAVDKILSYPPAIEKIAASSVAMDRVIASSVAINKVTASSVAMEKIAASSVAMSGIAASSTAVDKVIASSVAINKVTASSVAMEIIAASSVAMEEIAASSVALDKVIASSVAMDRVIASSVAMEIIAASSVAMDKVIASSVAMDRVIASSVAMSKVAESSVAMSKVAESSVFMNEIASSSMAMNAIASSSTAMNALYQHKSTLSTREGTVSGKLIILDVSDNNGGYATLSDGTSPSWEGYRGKFLYFKQYPKYATFIKNERSEARPGWVDYYRIS